MPIDAKTPMNPLRVTLFALPNMDGFLDDLSAGLAVHVTVRKVVVRTVADIERALPDSDICWFEFCWPPFIEAINQIDFGDKRVIVRLHAVEIVDTDYPLQLNWAKVDDLILVSSGIRKFINWRMPQIEDRVRISVIPNGLDPSRIPLAKNRNPFAIAWVGTLALHKNPMFALQIIAKLVNDDPRYHLHVAGALDSALVEHYLRHSIASLGLSQHVTFYGQVGDMAAWYDDKGVLLATTVHESFGFGIAEGMAAGLTPVVHHYPDADEFWPRTCLFDTIDQAVEMIVAAQQHSDELAQSHRAWVEDRVPLSKQLARTNTLLQAGLPLGPKLVDVRLDGTTRKLWLARPDLPDARHLIAHGLSGFEDLSMVIGDGGLLDICGDLGLITLTAAFKGAWVVRLDRDVSLGQLVVKSAHANKCTAVTALAFDAHLRPNLPGPVSLIAISATLLGQDAVPEWFGQLIDADHPKVLVQASPDTERQLSARGYKPMKLFMGQVGTGEWALWQRAVPNRRRGSLAALRR